MKYLFFNLNNLGVPMFTQYGNFTYSCQKGYTGDWCETGNKYSCNSKELPGGVGVLVEIFGEGMPSASPNPDPISDQKNANSHTRFQTWPQKSIPIFRPHQEPLA